MLKNQDQIKLPNHNENYLVMDIILLGNYSYAVLKNLDNVDQMTILEYLCKDDGTECFIEIEDDNLYQQLLFAYYLNRKKE